uniref:GTPase Era, mitochondrial n=1 Tax=Cacopsylla melanoneura TaxID=428564 RepID=A0A8D8S1Z2_9HEMI
MFVRTIQSLCVTNKCLFQYNKLVVPYYIVPKFCHHEAIRQSMSDNDVGHPDSEEEKLLKIAVIGLPNVGKSTLVNQLVKRRIFAMSRKVHTTKCRARGVYIENKSQLVFLDTPGLVSEQEKQRYHLEKEFVEGGKKAVAEADSILVIHDASNNYTRYTLDEKIMTILNSFPDKDTVLVINKVDAIKKKRFLLDMARLLTNDTLRKINNEVQNVKYKPETKMALEERISQAKGYSNFSDIFMVSALEGTGISDLRNYLLSQAKPSGWLFSEEMFTDQDPVVIIEDTVRSRMLNDLPQEVPYRANVAVEYLDFEREEPLCVCLIECPSHRVERVVTGSGGSRIRRIASSAEEELRMTFKIPLKLKLVVTSKSPKSFG